MFFHFFFFFTRYKEREREREREREADRRVIQVSSDKWERSTVWKTGERGSSIERQSVTPESGRSLQLINNLEVIATIVGH